MWSFAVGGVCIALFWAWLILDGRAQVRNDNAEFCAKNLAYYENLCKEWPDHCAEGARKKARCE